MPRITPTLLALLLSACAPAPTQPPDQPAPDQSARHLITAAEIESHTARNAYDLVTSIRPDWLRRRGVRTLRELAGAETLIVYLDNARLGAPTAMRRVTLASVRYIRFYPPPEATQRWGAGHLQGAILISTREPDAGPHQVRSSPGGHLPWPGSESI